MPFASEYTQFKKNEKVQIYLVKNPTKNKLQSLVSLTCRTLTHFGTNLEILAQHSLFSMS